MRQLVLLVHNVRSCHNVGSLLRTADGLGIDKVYLSGYSPYPAAANDPRLPHVAAKASRQIAKVSLGAEKTTRWEHTDSIDQLLEDLRKKGFEIVALEQSPASIPLGKYLPAGKVALIVGNEVDGIDQELLDATDKILEIPMLGKKESYNVAVAAGMALYHLRLH